MAFSVALLDALARYLADHHTDLGYAPQGGPVAAGRVPIYLDALPAGPGDPDRAVALALYPVDTDTGHTTATYGVQARVRGRPGSRTDTKDTADALFETLDNVRPGHLGSIPVVRVWQQSGADLPDDGNGRQHLTRNFYITLTRQTAARLD